MFGREKSKDFWWNPGVLTKENEDRTNPGLSSEEAEDIFEELRKRKLLVSKAIKESRINNGEPFLVHQINDDKKVEWVETIRNAF